MWENRSGSFILWFELLKQGKKLLHGLLKNTQSQYPLALLLLTSLALVR